MEIAWRSRRSRRNKKASQSNAPQKHSDTMTIDTPIANGKKKTCQSDRADNEFTVRKALRTWAEKYGIVLEGNCTLRSSTKRRCGASSLKSSKQGSRYAARTINFWTNPKDYHIVCSEFPGVCKYHHIMCSKCTVLDHKSVYTSFGID